jgi:hypothetical protein
MRGLPSEDQEKGPRQLRRALAGSWLFSVVICAVLVVLYDVPLVIVVAFFAIDTVVLAIVARNLGAKESSRGPSGLS